MTTIYQLEHSPFCIPIVAIFRALGVPLREVNVPNGDRSEIIRLTKGAYYQVPVLVDDDGSVVFESSAESQDVARYVDEKFAEGRLFPPRLTGIQAILISYLENEVEGVTFKLTDPRYLDDIEDMVERAMTLRHKERKFGRGCVEQWRQQAPQLRERAENLLLPFEQMLRFSPFLLGEAPVYADYLLLGIVGNLTYRGYNEIPPVLSSLKDWNHRMQTYQFE